MHPDPRYRWLAAGGPQTGTPFFRPVTRPPSPDEPQRRPTPPWSAMQEIGVRHCTFPSASFDCEVGYCIYLPPGYSDDGPALPVIYNLHGAGGNEFHSFDDVVNLHEGIVAGHYPPAIVVLPNGVRAALPWLPHRLVSKRSLAHKSLLQGFTWYKNSWDGRFPAETMFIEELIPHIDGNYATIAAHHGRCIEGYSMGGRGATRLAIKYPHLFCSLHNQAGNVLNLAMMGGQHDGDGRGLAPGWDAAHWEDYLMGFLGPDKSRFIDDDTFLNLEKNLDQIKGGPDRLQTASLAGLRFHTGASPLCGRQGADPDRLRHAGRHPPADLQALPRGAAAARSRPHVRDHPAQRSSPLLPAASCLDL